MSDENVQGLAGNCAICQKPLVTNAEFCAFCGKRVLPSDLAATIDARIETKLAERLKDQSSMIREIADKAEEVVWRRFRGYAWISGILIAVVVGFLGFYGFNTLNGVSERIEPIVKAGEQRAQAAKQLIDLTAAKTNGIKTAIDKLSTSLDVQTKRLNDKNSDISAKLGAFDAAQQAMEAYLLQSKDLSKRLADTQKALDTKVEQISRQVDDVAIRRTYPNLGRPLFVTLNGELWKGKAKKRQGERWVNISIELMSTGSFSSDQIGALVAALKEAGYTPIVGTFGVGGPYEAGYRTFDHGTQMQVMYFKKDAEQMASAAQAIASKVLSDHLSIKLLDPGSIVKEDPRRFILEQSGLDLQIFLSRW